MHVAQPGARFLGRFLRARREALGLGREEVRRRSHGGCGRPLPPTVLRDLETGDRLPTLARLAALARALELQPAELLEWVLLAPLLEDAEARAGVVPGPRDALVRAAERDLAADRPEQAAVRALAAWGGSGAPPRVLARAIVDLGRPLLGLLLAARCEPREGALEIEVEALRRLGLGGLARRILPARVAGTGPGLAAAGARLLEERDPLRAARAWADLLDRARAAGDARRAAEAAAGVARCLSRAGRAREAERYRRERDRWKPGPGGCLAPPGPGD